MVAAWFHACIVQYSVGVLKIGQIVCVRTRLCVVVVLNEREKEKSGRMNTRAAGLHGSLLDQLYLSRRGACGDQQVNHLHG